MYTHLAFSDESCYNEKQYRSLSLATLDNKVYENIKEKIRIIYEESNVSVLEWKKIESAKERLCAIKLIDLLSQYFIRNEVRVDVIIWDVEDSRHKIQGRDDIENLKRMYYHLMMCTLKKRWDDGLKWKIIPDEFTAINWNEVQEIFSTQEKGFHTDWDNLFSSDNGYTRAIRNYFYIIEMQEGKSHLEVGLQIADMFAGLAAFSHNNYDKYEEWLMEDNSLFPILSKKTYSKRDIERFKVIKHFDSVCKQNKLQVSLQSERGFISKNVKKSINFWLYIPQHELDKAPLRSKL